MLIVSQSFGELPTSAIKTLLSKVSTIVAFRPSFNNTVSYCFMFNVLHLFYIYYTLVIFVPLSLHSQPTTTLVGLPLLPYKNFLFVSITIPVIIFKYCWILWRTITNFFFLFLWLSISYPKRLVNAFPFAKSPL